VDSVEGLSPAISIEQKTVSRSPRSTVGTVTEVYDYLRLLFSSIGTPHCPQCGAPITKQSAEQIINGILALPPGERVMILAPLVRGRKGEFKKELHKLRQDGFVRARINNEIRMLDEDIRLDKRRAHTIEAVVDRLLIKPGINERLAESVRAALKMTGGAVLVSVIDGAEKLYSERMACVDCGINGPPLEPRSFSFNSSYGACQTCSGLAVVAQADPAKLIPDRHLPAAELEFLGTADKSLTTHLRSALSALCAHFGIAATTPYQDLPADVALAFWYGSEERLDFRQGDFAYSGVWPGAVAELDKRLKRPPSDTARDALLNMMSPVMCPACAGQRLQPETK
jgi:excinuclease ABC subunit A